MASFGFSYTFLCLCLLFLSCFAKTHSSSRSTHTVQLTSLTPSPICLHSSKGARRKHKSSLKVVHRHGPCSRLERQLKGSSAAEEILRQDVSRAESIRSRLSSEFEQVEATAATRLPAKSGRELGFGNYYVTVGLGTPKKDLSLSFDTGSDLTWTQCQPCDGHCYDQKDPIFDPSASSSYANQSCSSHSCSALRSSFSPCSTSNPESTCIYHVQYGDKSITEGYLATETLTLTPSDVMKNFIFGCGQNNGGLFVGIAGLLGLGRDTLSIVQQSAGTHGRLFSYCLPAYSSSTGHLTLGAATPAKTYTPMLTLNGRASFYGLAVTGISVLGAPLPAQAQAALRSAPAIIDSGTVITRLPAAAYRELSSKFGEFMAARYPPAAGPPSGLLDTCYDVSGAANGTITIPNVSIAFGGGAAVDLRGENILYMVSPSVVCLAFAAGNGLTVLGNVQQMGFDVVYDIGGARIGFTPDGC